MAYRNGREALRGAEGETLDLIFKSLTPQQWAGFLKSLFFRAADWGYGDLVLQLEEAGAVVIGDDAPHDEAALDGHREATNELQDPMANKSGREALRGAEEDTFDLLFELLPSEQWGEWLTAPLERAAARGKRDLAQQLFSAGAKIGDALHEAIYRGHGETVSVLLESGASPAAKDVKGCTPLHIAAVRGETEIVQLLLVNRADTEAFDDQDRTPLYQVTYHGHAAAARALLAAGADVNVPCGPRKMPAILTATLYGRVEILRVVIEQGGADLNAGDKNQNTALHFAAVQNNAEVIRMLVEAGANIEARDHAGHTALHHASAGVRRGALLCLLKHGANVNAQNVSRKTPLMISAAMAGNQGAAEVTEFLLRAGADETIFDDEGRRASDMIDDSIDEQGGSVEEKERVRKLLANAPADRAWRRRGYVVMCRAHPARLQNNQAPGTPNSDTARADTSDCQETAGGGRMGEIEDGDWTAVVSKVLWLQEEGVFRTIVGYL